MTGCSAIGCSNRTEQGYCLKIFPKDPKRRALWVEKVKRLNWVPTDRSFLCEVHFDADQWEKDRADGKKKLKIDAVPTIFHQSPKYRKRKSPIERSILQNKKLKPQIILDRSYVEGISSENVQVIRLSVPDHQDVSDSSPLPYTVISHSEPEVQNGIEAIEAAYIPQSSSSTSQETPENIFLSFYREFERSNRQLEKNDAAMLEIFKEQNDIFRTQTTLLMKFLVK